MIAEARSAPVARTGSGPAATEVVRAWAVPGGGGEHQQAAGTGAGQQRATAQATVRGGRLSRSVVVATHAHSGARPAQVT